MKNSPEYQKAYINQHYDIIRFSVPKGKRDELKDLAQERGVSVNELIIDALEKTYGIFIKRFKP